MVVVLMVVVVVVKRIGIFSAFECSARLLHDGGGGGGESVSQVCPIGFR